MGEKTEHDLTASAPNSTNIIGQTPRESGYCGVCHLVHNSENKIQLWARGFAEGNNVMEMMCNSCHSELGPARNKIPQVYYHPREKLIKITGENSSGQPEYFPLFHARSGEPVTSDKDFCSQCKKYTTDIGGINSVTPAQP